MRGCRRDLLVFQVFLLWDQSCVLAELCAPAEVNFLTYDQLPTDLDPTLQAIKPTRVPLTRVGRPYHFRIHE